MLNKQFIKLLWVPTLLILIAAIWSYNRYASSPINYIGVTTFYVGSSDTSALTDSKVYQYDQYYKLASASSFTETLISLFASPNTVSKIYQKSNIPLPSENPDQLARVIKSQKVSANSTAVIATISTDDKNATQKLTDNLPLTIAGEIDNFKKIKVIPSEITVSHSEPVFLENKNNILTAVGAPVVAGLIFGLALVYVIINARATEIERKFV